MYYSKSLKMKKILFFIALTMCFSGTSNAQFFKKLAKKVENAAENAVERKVEQKTKRETEKAFDSTFNKKRKKNKKAGMPGLSQVAPAESYAFNHKVEMEINSGKEAMHADYYLTDSGNFFGTSIKTEKVKNNFMTIFDVDREAMFTFMENEGQKMKMGVEFKTDDTTTEEPTFSITTTGNSKTILGYSCQEYKIAGEDMTATVWVTKEVDIRFPSTLYNTKKNQNNNQEWMNDLDGWAMEMVMVETSKRKPQTITMNCLSIEKSNLKINSNDYQNIGR